MRPYLFLCLLAALASPAFAQSSAGSMASIHSASTMPTCADGDPVVWINTRSKVYYTKGQSYFGKTSKGKYACLSAATAMGAHAPGATHHASSGTKPNPLASPRATEPSIAVTPIPTLSSSPSP